jgi:MFS family permease
MKFALLSTLYFSQGLPYGFFTQALPVWMRQSGMDLRSIGLTSLLALPWGLKFLWAPVVDRLDGSPLGRRRGWIVPLQAASILAVLGLAALGANLGPATPADAERTPTLLVALAVGMLVTNLVAATQDIATDGFALDLLSPSERGLGNGVQVAAYRVGMIVGGGGLLVVLGAWGFVSAFILMAALLALMTVPILRHEEAPRPSAGPPAAAAGGTTSSTGTPAAGEQPVTTAAALDFLRRGQGRIAVWCLAIGFYKFGDGFGSTMVRPLLVDRGLGLEAIGVIVGTAGSLAGMAGALAGGAFARRGRLRALVVSGLLHAVLMGAYAAAVGTDLPLNVVTALLVAEHVTGGMATVSLFTAMMDACDRRTGATDYTVQASVVVFASGAASSLSGFAAEGLGYTAHFVVAGVLCVLGTLAMVPLYRRGTAPGEPAAQASGHDDA